METPAPSSLAPQILASEQRAREFLSNSQWRKARDELKPLVKTDRARYLPLLILANVALSREMVSKGQVSEAQQVLSYLASIASAEQLRAAEQELDGKRPGTSADTGRFLEALANPTAQLTDSDKLSWADQLVLAFEPVLGHDPAQAGLAAEVSAVHEAILAATMQQWNLLTERLRGVPHRSVFSHWSAFLKGLAAFHTGEKERAIRFFSSLPPESVPGRAGQAYLLLAGKPAKAGQILSERVIESACRILGQPGAGATLLRADQQWKRGRYAESYKECRDRLPGFPSQDHDWLGALSAFYFNVPSVMSEQDRESYVDYFDELLARRATKNGVEDLLAHRMFALGEGERESWEAFLHARERLYGQNVRLASIVYTRLGEMMAEPEPTGFFGSGIELSDEKGAVECLRKAIALDPDNLEAHLTLAKVYTILKKDAERNRLLDRMVERFPEEKQVLVDAAAGCIQRKAFVKGLGYLDRARQLDQLDPRIPEFILTAQRCLAHQYYAQRRLDKARQFYSQMGEYLTDKPDDLQRSRWTTQLRQGLMEQQWGDREKGEALLASARESSPFPTAFLLSAHLLYRLYVSSPGPVTPFWPELNAAAQVEPRVSRAILLIRMLDHWRQFKPAGDINAERRLVRKYLAAACAQPHTRQEARQVIELKSGDPAWRNELAALIKKALRADRHDPLFRFYEFTLHAKASGNPRRARAELDAILAEAGRRGDETTAQKVRQLQKKLASPRRPLMPPPFDVDFAEEDEDEELSDLSPFDGLPPEKAAELALVLAALSDMSESELRQARRTRPKDMPAEMFDILVQLAKNGPPLMPPRPNPKPPRSAPERSNRGDNDPGRMNFF